MSEQVIDDLPWMTQLYALEFVREGSQVNVAIGQCGGTLIAPNWSMWLRICLFSILFKALTLKT